ncbi:hypothetical protein MVEG_12429, partial [Podila verticillata NRRL 6337]
VSLVAGSWNTADDEEYAVPIWEDRHDRYMLFEDYTYRNSLYVYLMQTPTGSMDEMRAALKHVLCSRHSYIHGYVGRASISVTFHVYRDGVLRPYTFNSSMGWKHMLRELDRILVDDGNEIGSDVYRMIHDNLCDITIGVMPMRSGRGGKRDYVYTIRVTNSSGTRDDVCFYRCIRTLLGLKWRYDTMITRLAGDTWKKGEVELSMIARAEEIFGINILVLYNKDPVVYFVDKTMKFGSYKDIKRDYVISWACYDGTSYGRDELCLKSKKMLPRRHTNGGMEVCVKGVWYHLLVFYDDHYDIVRDLLEPTFCGRCGSHEHTTKDADKYDDIKYECIATLSKVVGMRILDLSAPDRLYVFFDFETFMHGGKLHPYLVSYLIHDGTKKSVASGSFWGPGCSTKFLRMLTEDYGGIKYLISYNGASFDNYFIMRSLMSMNVPLSSDNTIMFHNKILRMCAKGVITWDLCQYTKSSLKEACDAYGIGDTKLEMDHDEIQEIFAKHNYMLNALDVVREMGVEEYCMHDVVLLSKLYYVIRRELATIADIDIMSKPTISSFVYSHATMSWRNHGIGVDKLPMSYDDIFSSVPGGRVQVLMPGEYNRPLAQLDVNSMYAHVCTTNDFPNGNIKDVQTHDESKRRLYMAFCDVDQTVLKYKLVANRNKDGRLVWTDNTISGAWLWKEEIEELRQHGCIVTTHRYLVWKKKVRPFDVMQTYLDARNKADQAGNIVGSKTSKLLSNALTGKMVEHNHDEVWTIGRHEHEWHDFADKYGIDATSFELTGMHSKLLLRSKRVAKEEIAKPRHWGSRIYALARLALWRHMCKFPRVYYVDTDSIVVDAGEEYTLSKEPGGMKLDIMAQQSQFVSPKTYRMDDKCRLKGYKDGSRWTAKLGDEVVGIGSNLCKEMYDHLLDPNVELYTKCLNITKRFVKKESNGTWKACVLQGEYEHKLLG